MPLPLPTLLLHLAGAAAHPESSSCYCHPHLSPPQQAHALHTRPVSTLCTLSRRPLPMQTLGSGGYSLLPLLRPSYSHPVMASPPPGRAADAAVPQPHPAATAAPVRLVVMMHASLVHGHSEATLMQVRAKECLLGLGLHWPGCVAVVLGTLL